MYSNDNKFIFQHDWWTIPFSYQMDKFDKYHNLYILIIMLNWITTDDTSIENG